MKNFLLFCLLILFSGFIVIVADVMKNDKNAIIRFIGYLLDIILAVLVLYIILYYYFNINLLEAFL